LRSALSIMHRFTLRFDLFRGAVSPFSATVCVAIKGVLPGRAAAVFRAARRLEYAGDVFGG
jgi:hypothetical protein